MRRRKLVLILGMVVLACVFAVHSFVYAAKDIDGAENKTSVKKVDDMLPPKGSAYDAIAALIEAEVFEGRGINLDKFRELRGINPATGKYWSDTTLQTEIENMKLIGMMPKECTNDNLYIRNISEKQFKALDNIALDIVGVVPTSGVDKGERVGLRYFDLAKLAQEKIDALREVVNDVIASPYSLAYDANPALFSENMVKTITLPASGLQSDEVIKNLSDFITSGADGKNVIILGASGKQLDAVRNRLVQVGLKLEGVERERLFFALSNKTVLLAVEQLFERYQESLDFTVCTGDNLSAEIREALKGGV